jgi:hypothetical protein
MTTLAVMKGRIADELARSDLASQIASAIGDSIGIYQPERFWFSESRSVGTFTTVAGQQDYTAADAAALGNLLAVDYLTVTVGGVTLRLAQREQPVVIEAATFSGTQQGDPYEYDWYDDTLRFFPIPAAAYAIRVAGLFKIAAPASDSEGNNPWMTDAERLIRSRAKYELALHVLKDPDLASAMAAESTDALSVLKGRTNRLTGTARITSTWF